MTFEDMLKKRKQQLQVLNTQHGTGFKHASLKNFTSNPAYRQVTQYKKYTTFGKDVGIHFVAKQRNYGDREIYFIPNVGHKFEIGDYILDGNNEMWLVFSNDTYPLWKGYLSLCNSTLRFLTKSKDIIEVPCTLTDKTSVYSDGLSRTEKMLIPNDQILVVVPDIPEIRELPYNTRIMFNNRSSEIYELVRRDTVHLDGIVHLRLKHAEFNKYTDSVEHGIADYYISPHKDDIIHNISDEEDMYSISINGYGNIAINTEEEYVATVKLAEGVINQDVIWELEETDLAEITSVDNNKITIKALCKDKYGDINLICKMKDDISIETNMKIKITKY